MVSGRAIEVAITSEEKGAIRFTQSGCRLDQRIEHRLQIEGRSADNFEHVGGGGLLLQRFAQLVEQPRVLDGDDCLVLAARPRGVLGGGRNGSRSRAST